MGVAGPVVSEQAKEDVRREKLTNAPMMRCAANRCGRMRIQGLAKGDHSAARLAWRSFVLERGSLVALRHRLSPVLPLSRPPLGQAILPSALRWQAPSCFDRRLMQ